MNYIDPSRRLFSKSNEASNKERKLEVSQIEVFSRDIQMTGIDIRVTPLRIFGNQRYKIELRLGIRPVLIFR